MSTFWRHANCGDSFEYSHTLSNRFMNLVRHFPLDSQRIWVKWSKSTKFSPSSAHKWEIQLMPDEVFANVTSFLMELTSLLKTLSCIPHNTAAYLLIPPQNHISFTFPIATNYPWRKMQPVVRRLKCKCRVYLSWVNLEKSSSISDKHVSIDRNMHKYSLKNNFPNKNS